MLPMVSTKVSFVMITLTIIVITAISISPAKINPAARPQLQVDVIVISDDSFTGIIQSYLHKELRALGDVNINTHTPDWTIVVSHLQRKNDGLHTFAVACAQAIPKHLLKPDLNQADKLWVANTPGVLENVFVISGGNLDEVCKMIIAQVDTSIFERIRQLAIEALLPITHPTYSK